MSNGKSFQVPNRTLVSGLVVFGFVLTLFWAGPPGMMFMTLT